MEFRKFATPLVHTLGVHTKLLVIILSPPEVSSLLLGSTRPALPVWVLRRLHLTGTSPCPPRALVHVSTDRRNGAVGLRASLNETSGCGVISHHPSVASVERIFLARTDCALTGRLTG
eukprot:3472235-Pyramimonas_sp.AAC.2